MVVHDGDTTTIAGVRLKEYGGAAPAATEEAAGGDDDGDRAPPQWTSRRRRLQRLLGASVSIRDCWPYVQALVHKSSEAEYGFSQERMELLGDAMLYAAVTVIFHNQYPLADERALSKLRTKVVNGATLALIGRAMHLEEFVVVAPLAAAQKQYDKIYEDTVEALIGAVYVDLGFEACVRFVASLIDRIDPEYLQLEDNYKEVLRRYARRNRLPDPTYDAREGAEGFVCTASVTCPSGGVITGSGQAPQRRRAEMLAAHDLLRTLGYEFAESVLPA